MRAEDVDPKLVDALEAALLVEGFHCNEAAKRGILAAVIPLVQQAERDRCIDDALNEYLAATNDDEDEGNRDMVARLKSQGAADGAGRIMQALRARSTP